MKKYPCCDAADKTARIRELNDAFRLSFSGGRVMLTSGFNALPDMKKSQVIEQIKTFTDFDPGNAPYQEHDFVSLEVAGQRFFAKIEYHRLRTLGRRYENIGARARGRQS
jgi:hypothetical protein